VGSKNCASSLQGEIFSDIHIIQPLEPTQAAPEVEKFGARL
jgi:hypothetical protein